MLQHNTANLEGVCVQQGLIRPRLLQPGLEPQHARVMKGLQHGTSHACAQPFKQAKRHLTQWATGRVYLPRAYLAYQAQGHSRHVQQPHQGASMRHISESTLFDLPTHGSCAARLGAPCHPSCQLLPQQSGHHALAAQRLLLRLLLLLSHHGHASGH